MTNKAITRFLIMGLAAGLAGCEGTRPPTQPPKVDGPTPVTEPGNRAFYVADVTVSGVVYEETATERVPLSGVLVANGEGWSGVTDVDGFFSFRPVWVCPCTAQPGVPASTTSIWIGKEGYGDPDGIPASSFGLSFAGPGYRDVAIDGDTRVEFRLVKRQS